MGGARHELDVGRVGLAGSLGGLDPEDLEVGEGRTELFFGKGLTLLELAQDGQDLVTEPALLGVRAQEEAYI
jgi:hypothetical protein